MAAADFCSHGLGFPSPPRLSGKPYSRVRSQISPNKVRELSLHKLAIYLGVCRERFCHLRLAHLRVSPGLIWRFCS